MNRAAIINARKVARQIMAQKAQRQWESQPIADLSKVQPVNRPRRILSPVY